MLKAIKTLVIPVDNKLVSVSHFYNLFYLGGVEEHISIEKNDVYKIICIIYYTNFDPNICFYQHFSSYLGVGKKR